ncbi:MAG: mechanosensitive ion channel [Proteobacteria bacterium]|nr:mechanosensitive ion channel [Pseudomonadota bacterium]
MNENAIIEHTSALWRMFIEYAPSVLGAFVVLVVGFYVASWINRLVVRALDRSRIDLTLRPLIASMVRYLVLALTALIVLQQFGVQTASLAALLGTVGLAIGLALQGTLSNVAAGLMLLLLRPFEVGDVIEAAGATGTVLSIDLFHTNMRSHDGVDIVVPNGSILSGVIRNMSHFPERVLKVNLSVAAGADLGAAISELQTIVGALPDLIAERGTTVAVKALSGGASDIEIQIWVPNEHYVSARTTLLTEVRQRFGQKAIALA